MIPNLVNLILCAAWGWSAMCRLHAMHPRVKLSVQLLYVGLFVLSVPCGLQFFFFGTLAGWPEVIASALLCLVLWRSMPHWRGGPPSTACRGC